MSPMPPQLRGLPLVARNALKRACGGDWSRVTFDGKTATVHNAPQTALRPAVKTYRRVELPPALPKISRPPVRRTEPQPEPRPVTPAVTERVPASRVEPVRQEPVGWMPAPVEIPPRLLIRPDGTVTQTRTPYSPVKLPPDEALRAVYQLQKMYPNGLGHECSIEVYGEVEGLAGSGIDLENAVSVARNAKRCEIRPESRFKGYPILKFSVGDVDVIVGFGNPQVPCILRVDQNSILQHDTHRVYSHGGGGAKKQKGKHGTPSTPEKIRTALIALGCTIPDLVEKPVDVVYKQQCLGKLSPKAVPPADAIRTWDSFYRKWDAINRKYN